MRTDNFKIALIEVGERLKLLRKSKGFATCDEFSKRFDLPQDQYWKLESGNVNLNFKALFRVLEIHKLTLEDFFCLEVKKKVAA